MNRGFECRDCCHELMGHIPLLTNKRFAQISHEIGVLSLGLSDQDIINLSICYFFCVEFGLSLENGKQRVFGAGILSSADELEVFFIFYLHRYDSSSFA